NKSGLTLATSVYELLGEDALVEAMSGVEKHRRGDRAVFGDIDMRHVAHFKIVRHGADRALYRFQDFEPRACAMGEKGTMPAARTECADRRQREQRRIDRQDGAVC